MRHRQLAMALGALGLALAVVASVTCGGNSEAGVTTPAHLESPAATATESPAAAPGATEGPTPLFAATPPPARFEKRAGGPQPILPGPPAAYAIAVNDLGPGAETEREATYEIGADGALVPYFRSTDEAAQLLGSWGFLGGFTSAFNPPGLLAGVLIGRYYVVTETYLFSAVDGARQAYQHIAGTLRARAGAEEIDMRAVGNVSSAVKLALGVVENSQTPAVYHRAVFQRGNLVGVVQTYGAAALMRDSTVGELAAIMDGKTLGPPPSPSPTPAR
jgi:hypothetical protein